MARSEALIRAIKCADVALLGCYYLALGLVAAVAIRRVFDARGREEGERGGGEKGDGALAAMPLPTLVGRIVGRTCLIMVATYLIRVAVKRIPFPLDGVGGFRHARVKEINGGVIIAFSVIALQTHFVAEIKHLVDARLGL